MYSSSHSAILKITINKERLISYAQNVRQQKTSQAHQRLFFSDHGEERTGNNPQHRNRSNPEID